MEPALNPHIAQVCQPHQVLQVDAILADLTQLAQDAKSEPNAFVFVVKGLLWLHMNHALYDTCPATFHKHQKALWACLQSRSYKFEATHIESDLRANSNGHLLKWQPKACDVRSDMTPFLSQLMSQQQRTTYFPTQLSLIMCCMEWVSRNTWLMSQHAGMDQAASTMLERTAQVVPALGTAFAHLSKEKVFALEK